MAIMIVCESCNQVFSPKRRARRFCSKPCQNAAQRTGSWTPCAQCGKETYRERGVLQSSGSTRTFCSHACHGKWRAKQERTPPRERVPASAVEVPGLPESQYFTGQPCRHGHVAPRYKINRRCVECLRERQQVWQATHPDREKLIRKAHKANQRAKIHGAGERIKVADVEAMFAKFGAACLACGGAEGVGIDHVIPLSRGGRNHISNLQPLCLRCNQRKRERDTDYRINGPGKA